MIAEETIANETELTSLQSHGYCLLRGLMSVDLANQLRRDMYNLSLGCGVIAVGYTSNAPMGEFYTRPCVIKDNQKFAPMLTSPRLTSTLDNLLGPAARVVTATTMIIQEPGTKRGPWHAGEPYDAPSSANLHNDRATHATAVLFCTKFDAENGGLLVLPDSHRGPRPDALSDSERTQSRQGEIVIEGEMGDVLILDSRTWRAVAADESDLMRIQIVTGFATSAGINDSDLPRDPGSWMYQRNYDILPENVKPMFRHWQKK